MDTILFGTSQGSSPLKNFDSSSAFGGKPVEKKKHRVAETGKTSLFGKEDNPQKMRMKKASE